MKVVIRGVSNYYRKNSWQYAESFVEIKFEICSIYEAQCAKENSPFKLKEQFCKILIA